MYITCIHFGGGSMVEASTPVRVFGPYNTNIAADAAGRWFCEALTVPYLQQETWYEVTQIPDNVWNPMEQAKEWEQEMIDSVT